MERPNIVFYFSDQQRYDTVGVYGQKLNITPNLDKLAEDGVRFEHAFTSQPVCGPARSCIQTGKYATESGCFRNDIALSRDEKTIAHYIRESGYDTAYIGKWHLASTMFKESFKKTPVPLEKRGGWEDYWMASDLLEFTSTGYEGHLFNRDMEKVDFHKYRVDALTDFGIDYLENNRNIDKPFFLFISYLEPHHQNTTKRYEGPIGSKERFKDFEAPEDLKGKNGDWKESYPDYLGACNSLDYNLGRLIEKLGEMGIKDNTIIIYTSDHGSHFKTRNLEYKRSCHESSIRIPLIINGPGFKGGKVMEELVSLMDIAPTFLQAAGLEKPNYMNGNPLQNLINGSIKDWKEDIYVQISENQVGRALRTKRWKYSVKAFDKNGWIHKDSDVYIEEFLYDLEIDPYEKDNLVLLDEYKEVREELGQILQNRMIEAEEPAARILPRTQSNIIKYRLKLPFNILKWIFTRK